MSVVMLIDDDPLQARLITDNLETLGHHVLWSRQSWDGLLEIYRVRPDLIILDAAVPQWQEFLTLLRALRGMRTTPLLLIASRCPSQSEMKSLAVAAFLRKHFDAQTLVEHIQHLLTSVRDSSFQARQGLEL